MNFFTVIKIFSKFDNRNILNLKKNLLLNQKMT